MNLVKRSAFFSILLETLMLLGLLTSCGLNPTSVPNATATPAPVSTDTSISTPVVNDYAGKIGVELAGIGAQEFVDIAKTLRPWEAIGGGPAEVDEQGWPLTDASTVFFDMRPTFAWAPPIDDPTGFHVDMSGAYKLSFTGHAVIAKEVNDPGADTFTVENQVYDPATNTTTADIIVKPGKSLLFVRFTQTDGGIKNVRLIRPGYPADSQQLFTDAFLKAVQPFKVLRFMDWLSTNDSNPPFTDADHITEWNERRLPGDATQTSDGKKSGVAWEYVIALANQTGKDIWINIPVSASDDYIRQLAEMMKKDLDPSITIYFEHSNEVWNMLFSQTPYNRLAAEAEVAAGNSNLNNDGSTSPSAWALRRHARRTVEIGQIFAEVFGQEALNTRIRAVFSWKVGETQQYRSALEWIQATYGDPSQHLYAIAGAPYFNAGAATASAQHGEILEIMAKSSDSSVKARTELIALANEYGVKPVLYEGGPDNGGGDPTNVANRILANRDPRMGGLVMHDINNNWFQLGGDLYMYFALNSYYNRYGSWGLTEDLTNLSTPKFNAIYTLLGQPVYEPPPPPVSMSAKVDDGTISLTWPEVYRATGYNLLRFNADRARWETIAENVAETTYTDTGLTNKQVYRYAIQSVNAAGAGDQSITYAFRPKPLSEQPDFAANLLVNPDFTSGTNGWNIFFSEPAAKGTATLDTTRPEIGATSVRFEIEKGGTETWHVMLFQPFNLIAGNTYEISFVAAGKSDNPMSMIVNFEHGGDPWTNYWQEAITLSETPTLYGPYTFQSANTDDNVSFFFRMGTDDASTIWIGNPIVRQVDGDKAQEPAGNTLSEGPKAKIIQTSEVPLIDGRMDDLWNKVVPAVIANVNKGEVATTQDLSGSFRLMWDQDNLYVLAEVTDDALFNDSPETHADDAVELYLDPQYNRGTTYDDYDVQLKFGWDDVAQKLADSRGPHDGVVYASLTTETGYIIEAAIPWTTLGVTPSVGAQLGLEVMLCDDDNGLAGEAKMAWWATKTDDAWTNPSAFGSGFLLGPEG